MRGPTHGHHKHAELKPSPMWSSIGGAASRKPAWRAQAGFTPTGMTTPAQKLQKSMNMGKVDGSAGLKPLDIKVAEVNQMRLHPTPTLKPYSAPAPNPSFRPKLAFQMSQYSGDMSLPPMQYASGIPSFNNPPVKTAGPPSEKSRVKKADAAIDPDEDLKKGLTHAGIGAGVGLGGLGGTAVGGHFFDKAVRSEPADSVLTQRLIRGGGTPVFTGKNLGVQAMFVPAQKGLGADIDSVRALHKVVGVTGADPLKSHVVMGELANKPSVLAHELGHASLHKSRFGRAIQNPLLVGMSPLRGTAALALGAATGSSDDSRIRKAGLIGAGLMTAPQLMSEAGASLHGYRNLKALGASPEQLRAARRALLPAFGTYAGRAAGTVGVALLGSGIARALKDEPPPPKVASVSSPSSQLRQSQATGAPKVSAPPGPSIAQISKPKGFGTPMSGAKKGTSII